MFRIHLLAWPCGSMLSGQRRELARMMPFSLETRSAGSPWTCQPRSLIGSFMTLESVAPSVAGTPSLPRETRHSPSHAMRYPAMKGPR